VSTLSLRARLSLAVAGVLVASLVGFSLVLDSAFRRALIGQFDARLLEDAVAVAGMIEYFPDGHWEFEAATLPGFEAGGGAFFEVRTQAGQVIARSDSLAGRQLPDHAALRERVSVEAFLPNGGLGRLLEATLPARPGDERSREPLRAVVVSVLRGTEEVSAAVARLRLLLWASGLVAMTLASIAGTLAVRRGLVPVGRLNERLDTIDARALREPLPSEALPAELRPTVVKLNDLLTRLAESFERERRFSADASHELRTPLAAIRSILEVSASRERPPAEYRAAMREALDVSRRMSALVESLLALARLDSGADSPRREQVVLRDVLDECLASFSPRAAERRLRVANQVSPEVAFGADLERVRTIILNLLGNAVEYTSEGGAIVVASDLVNGVLLEVRDSGPPLPAEAIEPIFERFFRLDSARSSAGEHWGIGLALVRSLCDSLGLTVLAENSADGWVSFRIILQDPRKPARGDTLAPTPVDMPSPETTPGRAAVPLAEEVS